MSIYEMRVYFILLIVAITVCNVKAGTSIIMSDAGSEDLGDCYTTADGIGAINGGEKIQKKGECAIVFCSDDREIQEHTCGVMMVDPPCTVSEQDLSKPYPDCCGSIRCPEEPLPN
ncbi:uncharacterized protein [Diabrotica undecimpunctata]|uniref:uncharacterized protein n=1 Tax=Diabrotica undecimpunctata TaxID=50387 RepID=UPI003B63ADE9